MRIASTPFCSNVTQLSVVGFHRPDTVCQVATALRVPLVCARETHENDTAVIEMMYSAPSESFTKKKKLVLYVTKELGFAAFLGVFSAQISFPSLWDDEEM